MFDLQLAQQFMRNNQIDGWLIYDFRGSNPIMWQVIGDKKRTTRRNFAIIPADGEPMFLAHIVDSQQFVDISFPVKHYMSWQEMIKWIRESLKGCKKVAMEYSPEAAIPAMSRVDAGTIDLIRSFGVEVATSADLFQIAAAMWSEEAFKSHVSASKEVNEIKDMAFDYIRQAIRASRSITEYEVQEFIMKEFQRRNLETENRPSVCVNENSGKQHYEATPKVSSQIVKNDWVLIDLWARHPGEENVFCDITWVSYAGQEIPTKQQEIFEVVRGARDMVIERLKDAWDKGEALQGWELDMVARNHIEEAGYGKRFVHRTGHSMGPGEAVHALGVNLDNSETHDTRRVLPGIGFSVEPGIYLPDFGVRLETNVFIDHKKGPVVTAPLQERIVKLA